MAAYQAWAAQAADQWARESRPLRVPISPPVDDGVTERLKQERRERAKRTGRYTMQITRPARNRREQ
jgi:hypothetical protein